MANVEQVVLESAVKETREGYKTTEFWIVVGTALATYFNGIPLPESKEGYVLAGLAAVYAVARGIAKSGVPAPKVE